MIRSSSCLAVVFLAALTTTSLLAVPAARAGDSNDICDSLAASSNDTTRPAGVAGIEEDKIDVGKALPACRDAYAASNQDPRLAFQLGRVLMKDGKKDEALALYEQSAKAGHSVAMVNYAVAIEDERPADAFASYKQAAETGDALGQYNLGVAYQNGVGVAADGKLALEWFKKSSDQGDGWSAYNIGVLHDEGKLLPVNKPEAVTFYRLAADRGIADAMINLAMVLETGDGVPADKASAATLYEQAAALGDADGIAAVKRMKDAAVE